MKSKCRQISMWQWTCPVCDSEWESYYDPKFYPEDYCDVCDEFFELEPEKLDATSNKQGGYGMKIFIPGNCPSLKNSKQAVPGKGVFYSKTVKNYLRSLGIQDFSSSKKTVKGYVRTPNKFEGYVAPLRDELTRRNEWPIEMGYHFVRGSRHRFDLGNAWEIIQDLLTAHDVIPDDSADYLIPMPIRKDGLWYTYDKRNPGVIIWI